MEKEVPQSVAKNSQSSCQPGFTTIAHKNYSSAGLLGSRSGSQLIPTSQLRKRNVVKSTVQEQELDTTQGLKGTGKVLQSNNLPVLQNLEFDIEGNKLLHLEGENDRTGNAINSCRLRISTAEEQDLTVQMIMKEEAEAVQRQLDADVVSRDEALESGTKFLGQFEEGERGLTISSPSCSDKLHNVELERQQSLMSQNNDKNRKNGENACDGARSSHKAEFEMVDFSRRRFPNSSSLPTPLAVFEDQSGSPSNTGGQEKEHSIPYIIPLIQPGFSGSTEAFHLPIRHFLPRKIHLNNCDKCTRLFFSTVNLQRHLSTHKKKKKTNQDKGKSHLRLELASFLSKLSGAELKKILSLSSIQVQGLRGEDAFAALKSLLVQLRTEFYFPMDQQTEYRQAYQTRLSAAQGIMLMLEGRLQELQNGSHWSENLSEVGEGLVKECLLLLDMGSEVTFLEGDGNADTLQKSMLQRESTAQVRSGGRDKGASLVSLEPSNVVAVVAFMLELKMIRSLLAHKDAEALIQQEALLVQEEEAAHLRKSKLKRKKKPRSKGEKDRDEKAEGENAVPESIPADMGRLEDLIEIVVEPRTAFVCHDSGNQASSTAISELPSHCNDSFDEKISYNPDSKLENLGGDEDETFSSFQGPTVDQANGTLNNETTSQWEYGGKKKKAKNHTRKTMNSVEGEGSRKTKATSVSVGKSTFSKASDSRISSPDSPLPSVVSVNDEQVVEGEMEIQNFVAQENGNDNPSIPKEPSSFQSKSSEYFPGEMLSHISADKASAKDLGAINSEFIVGSVSVPCPPMYAYAEKRIIQQGGALEGHTHEMDPSSTLLSSLRNFLATRWANAMLNTQTKLYSPQNCEV